LKSAAPSIKLMVIEYLKVTRRTERESTTDTR